MSRYLDPKADVVFKRIFGDHPHLLISFLNAILPLPEDTPIVTITYLPSEQVPAIPEFRRTIVDVKCTDALGRVFIVEMQMNWTDAFKQRLLFGTSQAFVKQLNKGEQYDLLQPVYGVGLVAQAYDPVQTNWYHHYKLVQKGNEQADVIDHLQLIFIELPKFPAYSTEEKRLRLLWLRFLRDINEKTEMISADLLAIPEIAEAVSLAEQSAYTPAELDSYQSYWDAVSAEKTLLSGAYKEGRAEGLAEGEAKGLAEGEAKGLAKGEAKAKIEMIKKMLYANLSMADMMLVSGLSAADIEAIKTEQAQ